MKRHPCLRAFSDDHHQGLVNARRLRRAASGEGASSADSALDFLEFWQTDTSLHFRKEEEVLLPVLARNGGDLGEQPILQMLSYGISMLNILISTVLVILATYA